MARPLFRETSIQPALRGGQPEADIGGVLIPVLFSGMADATHIPFAELHGIAEMEYARVDETERHPVTIANIYSITI